MSDQRHFIGQTNHSQYGDRAVLSVDAAGGGGGSGGGSGLTMPRKDFNFPLIGGIIRRNDESSTTIRKLKMKSKVQATTMSQGYSHVQHQQHQQGRKQYWNLASSSASTYFTLHSTPTSIATTSAFPFCSNLDVAEEYLELDYEDAFDIDTGATTQDSSELDFMATDNHRGSFSCFGNIQRWSALLSSAFSNPTTGTHHDSRHSHCSSTSTPTSVGTELGGILGSGDDGGGSSSGGIDRNNATGANLTVSATSGKAAALGGGTSASATSSQGEGVDPPMSFESSKLQELRHALDTMVPGTVLFLFRYVHCVLVCTNCHLLLHSL